MDKDAIITRAIDYIRDFLKQDASGHDWWHIHRVYVTSVKLAEEMDADLFVCSLAAIFHDRADSKIVQCEQEGLEFIRSWLMENGVNVQDIDHISEIISTMSFKGGNNPPMRTLEGEIVQDADRLDALGAIGIARTFAYSGSKGRQIYEPALKARENMSVDEYRSGNSSAINHFYEKLLKLKPLFNTELAKELAEDRHEFMEEFLSRFYDEWNGRK